MNTQTQEKINTEASEFKIIEDVRWHNYDYRADTYFCSQGCKFDWLNHNMQNIEQGRPIEFIRHRREIGGYERTTEESYGRKYYSIKRVDNRTEIE